MQRRKEERERKRKHEWEQRELTLEHNIKTRRWVEEYCRDRRRHEESMRSHQEWMARRTFGEELDGIWGRWREVVDAQDPLSSGWIICIPRCPACLARPCPRSAISRPLSPVADVSGPLPLNAFSRPPLLQVKQKLRLLLLLLQPPRPQVEFLLGQAGRKICA